MQQTSLPPPTLPWGVGGGHFLSTPAVFGGLSNYAEFGGPPKMLLPFFSPALRSSGEAPCSDRPSLCWKLVPFCVIVLTEWTPH